jgi:hypothetical protein
MAKTTQKIGLLRMVLNIFISVRSAESSCLQLIMLNKFIKMNVWKMIVLRVSLSGTASSSAMRFTDPGKKIIPPKYIRKIITST